jgi:A/G-specific adenine glycosylase
MLEIKEYSRILLEWAKQNPRPMPWKGIDNPYFIWLSEIILQQTRVEQGLPYYERFVSAYPTVVDLAKAPEDELLKLWEGLGYYSRARNLQEAAKAIVIEYGGVFPSNYQQIRSLKGVGDYTAAAIASFAYNQPYAVLDGNVFRVIARWRGIETPIDSSAGRKLFSELANSILDSSQPGAHNQAMMDFGATWCTPLKPKCSVCPFSRHCRAYQEGKVDVLPVKAKKVAKKERLFLYFVFRNGESTYFRKRLQKDFWRHLYEFPALEPDTLPVEVAEINRLLEAYFSELTPSKVSRISKVYRQTLSHRQVSAIFVEVHLLNEKACIPDDWVAVPWNKSLPPLALPRLLEWYWKEKEILASTPNLFD